MPPAPLSPYASSGGIINVRFPPSCIAFRAVTVLLIYPCSSRQASAACIEAPVQTLFSVLGGIQV